MMPDAEKRRFGTFLILDLERRGVIFSRALVRSQSGDRETMELLEEHNRAVREWTADIDYLDIVAARAT
jgi:hypothetical protein